MVGVYNLYMYLCTLRLGERHKSCGHCRRRDRKKGQKSRWKGKMKARTYKEEEERIGRKEPLKQA